MTFSTKINAMLSVGIRLHDSNIHNWALTKDQALDIVEKFEQEQLAIAGGDVLDDTNGEIGFTGDSWYSDRMKDETYIDYVKRSIKETREYIVNYPSSKGIYFAIVPM